MEFIKKNSPLTATELMFQSQTTVSSHLHAAKKAIDQQFGEGYAKSNPDLLGACLIATVHDFKIAVMATAYQDLSKNLDDLARIANEGIQLFKDYIDGSEDHGN